MKSTEDKRVETTSPQGYGGQIIDADLREKLKS